MALLFALKINVSLLILLSAFMKLVRAYTHYRYRRSIGWCPFRLLKVQPRTWLETPA